MGVPVRVKRGKTPILACLAFISLIATSCAPASGVDNNPIITSNGVTDTSPLTEFWALAWPGSDIPFAESAAQQLNEELRRQEIIAQCMHEAGFEYLIDISWVGTGTEYTDAWRPDDRDWVAQFGFGVMDPVGSGQIITSPRMDSDPNFEIRERLSPAELEAYWIAFSGPPSEIETHSRLPEPQGCFGQGVLAVPWEQSRMESAGFGELEWALVELDGYLRNEHPAVLEVYSDWASCMADAGHPGLSRPWDGARQIQRHKETILTGHVTIPWEDHPNNPNNSGQPIPPPTGLAELQEQEITLALDDFDCRKSVNFSERIRSITITAETQFFADYRTQLEAFRAWAEQN
jgi:hypothetical protein